MVGGAVRTEIQYVYEITEVVKVVDGDSYWLRVDVGFRQENLINVRLHGYDCPERNKGSVNERKKAIEAHKLAEEFLTVRGLGGGQLWIKTYKDPDNFGRWLGDIWIGFSDWDANLGAELHHRQLASLWPTRWREEFDAA